VLIAGPFGFAKREFFEAEPEAQDVPTVNLGFGAPNAGQTAPQVNFAQQPPQVPPMAPPPPGPPMAPPPPPSQPPSA